MNRFIDDRNTFDTEKRFFDRNIKRESGDIPQKAISFVQSTYNRHRKSTSVFQAIWINCDEGDGVSWLCEKICDYFSDKKLHDNSVRKKIQTHAFNHKRNIEGYPIITKLIGEKSFIKIAFKSNLLPKEFRFTKILLLSLLLFSVVFTLGLLTYKWIVLKSFESAMQTSWVFILLPLIVALLNKFLEPHHLFGKSKIKDEILKRIKRDKKDTTEYKNFVENICKHISLSLLPYPRVIIIDDFCKYDNDDDDGFTHKVLLNYFNNDYSKDRKKGHDFWVITDTTGELYKKQVRERNSVFSFVNLQNLSDKERETFVKDFPIYEKNLNFRQVKYLCREGENKEKQEKLMEKIQKKDRHLIEFLHFITLNSYPDYMDFPLQGENGLIPNICGEKGLKENYIPIIFGSDNQINSKNVERDFDNLKNDFSNYLISASSGNNSMYKAHFELFELFKNNNNVKKLNLTDNFYLNGYWAIYWYDSIIKRNHNIEIPFMRKLSYHLRKSNVKKGMSNVEGVLECLINAHLFVLNNAVNLFLKKEFDKVFNSIDLLFTDWFSEINVVNKHQLLKLYNFYTTNFLEYKISSNIHRINTTFNNFSKNVNIKTFDLLDSDAGKYLQNEIIFKCLIRNWENVFVLLLSKDVFSSNYVKGEFTKLNTYIDNNSFSDLSQEDQIRNLSLKTWINTISLSTTINDNNIELVQTIITDIELFVTHISKLNIKELKDNIAMSLYIFTIYETALIIIASIEVLIKNDIKQNLREKLILIGLENTIRSKFNYTNKKVNDLMGVQSLVWKRIDYDYRHYIIKLIHNQFLILTKTEKERKLQTQVKPIEEDIHNLVRTNTPLDAIANLSLSFLFKSYNAEVTSYYFQNFCTFIKNDNISSRDIDCLFLILVKFYESNISLSSQKEVTLLEFSQNKFVDFINNSEDKNKLLTDFISQDNIGTYGLKIINGLKYYVYNENLYRIINELATKYNSEEVMGYLKNLWFSKLTDEEKIKDKNKQDYKSFWDDKKDWVAYSTALRDLLIIDPQNNDLQDEVLDLFEKYSTWHDYNNARKNNKLTYSGYFSLAVEYCNLKLKNYQDFPLPFVWYDIIRWEDLLGASTMLSGYRILWNEYKGKEYWDKYNEFTYRKLLEDKVKHKAYIDNKSFFKLFNHTYVQWEHLLYISKSKNSDIFDATFDRKKEFIDTNRNIHPIFIENGKEKINENYILVGRLLNNDEKLKKHFDDKYTLVEKYAKDNFKKLTEMVLYSGLQTTNIVSILKEYYSKINQYTI